MMLNLTYYSSEPLHLQISRQIAKKILDGDIKTGSLLMPVNKLATEQHINKSAVRKAYQQLNNEGVIKCRTADRYSVNNLTGIQMLKLKKELEGPVWSAEEKVRIKDELDSAKQIQDSLLPKGLPQSKDVSIAAYSISSKEVGGDFYDVLPFDDNSFGIVVGDASGKGMPAAMLILQIQAILKSGSNNRPILQTIGMLNEYLVKNTPRRHFASLFLGIYNRSNGLLTFVNAGQNNPVVLRCGGSAEYLKTTGPALGIIERASFHLKKIKLSKGDTLVLFTDGITEAMNAGGELYGEERLTNVLIDNNMIDGESIINAVINDVKYFCGSSCENDDATMMILKKS